MTKSKPPLVAPFGAAETGQRDGLDTQEALARSGVRLLAQPLATCAIRGGGSFAAPSGARSLAGWPSIGQVSFSFWNIDVDRDHWLMVVDKLKGEYRSYRIKELYARRSNAEQHQLELMKKALTYLNDDMQYLQAKLEVQA